VPEIGVISVLGDGTDRHPFCRHKRVLLDILNSLPLT
jgi:hypothetical protein